jgi:uncharacterized protein YukE
MVREMCWLGALTTKHQPTRHGVRLTVEQLKEILPRLVEFVNEVEDELEQEERSREE